MHQVADSSVFWVAAIMALAGLFLLPTVIGLARGVDRLALVVLVNLIGAPLLLGWPAALILAFGPRRHPPPPRWSAHRDSSQRSVPLPVPGEGDRRERN